MPSGHQFPSPARLAALAGIASAATAMAACAGGPPATDAPGLASTEDTPMTGKVVDNPRAEWPFRFEHHNFGVYCYDAIGCQVRYGGSFPHGARDEHTRSKPKPGDQRETQRAWNGTRLAIKAFASPVRARWKSLDGEQHEIEIDLDEVFPERLVLHNVAYEDLAERGYVGRPNIVVVVEDRTVSVWMSARVPTRELQVAGNPLSRSRSDWIQAWSRTL